MSSAGGFFDFHERVSRRPTVAPSPKVTVAKPLTVSELTYKIDGVIRGGFPGTVQVRGELSNWKPNAASGHAYFTLKDSKSCINCVMWRSEVAKLRHKFRDGMEILATGRIAVYEAQGKYQLYCDRLEPMGQGALELAFQELRRKLEAEGLFAAERKRAIPSYPLRIAMVTSSGAAALADMLKVLRRCPWVRLCLYSVPVQGDGAATKIAAAIGHLTKLQCADVVLLARGGGSLEDLWQFNEEIVARAVAASGIPIVTGIGHEVDVSIADLVADHHAHTPTEAAQVVVQHWKHARDRLDQFGIRMRRGLRAMYSDARHRLNFVERHEIFVRPLARINRWRQLLDDRQRQLDHAIETRLVGRFRQRLFEAEHRLKQVASGIMRRKEKIEALAARLEALNPDGVLRRGYSITRVKKSGDVVRDPSQVKAGERIVTKLANGELESVVEDSKQMPLFE